MYSKTLARDIIEWDVLSWQRVLPYWDRVLGNARNLRVLDAGARNGGLSLYFALKGLEVVCSDVKGPSPKAAELHRRYHVEDRVQYAAIDMTAIDAPDATFDVVCFKSVLGGMGRNGEFARQQQAVSEAYRVLKPGGLLLFAENLTATRTHMVLRKQFSPWAWRFISPDELPCLLKGFKEVDFQYYGFFATFGRKEFLRTALHALDVLANPFIPDRNKYIVYGVARK